MRITLTQRALTHSRNATHVSQDNHIIIHRHDHETIELLPIIQEQLLQWLLALMVRVCTSLLLSLSLSLSLSRRI